MCLNEIYHLSLLNNTFLNNSAGLWLVYPQLTNPKKVCSEISEAWGEPLHNSEKVSHGTVFPSYFLECYKFCKCKMEFCHSQGCEKWLLRHMEWKTSNLKFLKLFFSRCGQPPPSPCESTLSDQANLYLRQFMHNIFWPVWQGRKSFHLMGAQPPTDFRQSSSSPEISPLLFPYEVFSLLRKFVEQRVGENLFFLFHFVKLHKDRSLSFSLKKTERGSY